MLSTAHTVRSFTMLTVRPAVATSETPTLCRRLPVATADANRIEETPVVVVFTFALGDGRRLRLVEELDAEALYEVVVSNR